VLKLPNLVLEPLQKGQHAQVKDEDLNRDLQMAKEVAKGRSKNSAVAADPEPVDDDARQVHVRILQQHVHHQAQPYSLRVGARRVLEQVPEQVGLRLLGADAESEQVRVEHLAELSRASEPNEGVG